MIENEKSLFPSIINKTKLFSKEKASLKKDSLKGKSENKKKNSLKKTFDFRSQVQEFPISK